MAIIVEGFDNSGKSTLARALGLVVVHPGPRPKTFEDEERCLQDQFKRCANPIVMDRVTALSTPAYTGMLDQRYDAWIRRMLDTPYCVLIYCRPPLGIIMDFTRHVVKSYDDEAELERLRDQAPKVVQRYDSLMASLPHASYDYTNPSQDLLDQALSATHTKRGWHEWKDTTKP